MVHKMHVECVPSEDRDQTTSGAKGQSVEELRMVVRENLGQRVELAVHREIRTNQDEGREGQR